jgi:hypothetical protein
MGIPRRPGCAEQLSGEHRLAGRPGDQAGYQFLLEAAATLQRRPATIGGQR